MGAGGRVATTAAMLVHLSCKAPLNACATRQSPALSWFSSTCRCALHWVSVGKGRLPLLLLAPLLAAVALLAGELLAVELGLLRPLLLVAGGALAAKHVVAAPAAVSQPAKHSTAQWIL